MRNKFAMGFIGLMVLAIVGICGMAYSAVTEGTFGGQNSSKAYRMSVDSTGAITLASDSTLSGGTIVVGDVTPAAGSFTTITASGVITDLALYSKSAVANPVRLVKVDDDGTLYGSNAGTRIIEVGLVTASAGAGNGRLLCISTDGSIYSIAAGACY